MLVEITNPQSTLPIDPDRIERLVREILLDAPCEEAEISVAVVDDPTIHELNRRTLQHDYPTDVLSFCLEETPTRLAGEIVVSADTAVRNAEEYGWSAGDELLLYVAHGALHLVGHRDKSDAETLAMRRAEADYLARIGVACPVDHTTQAAVAGRGGPS